MWLVGSIFIALGVLMCVLLFSLKYEELWRWYEVIRQELAEFEQKIASIKEGWLFAISIILLFAIKSVFPIYLTSTVCFLTGIVLPFYYALPVNMLGVCVLFSLKYYGGFLLGAGNGWKLVSKSDTLRRIIQRDGTGNPWLLMALRMVPVMPINTTSAIYGSFRFGFWKFLGLSLIGFMPRLVSFTIVGKNVFDPLSASFLVPMILLSFFTGTSILSINGVWVLIEKMIEFFKKRKIIKGEKQNAKRKKNYQ